MFLVKENKRKHKLTYYVHLNAQQELRGSKVNFFVKRFLRDCCILLNKMKLRAEDIFKNICIFNRINLCKKKKNVYAFLKGGR